MRRCNLEATTHCRPLLQGYRVLDLTDERGQFCGKLLADLGAEVIKVERPGGDDGRDNLSSWLACNLGKRSVTLDVDSERVRNTFAQLVERSDVVVESFDPGYMAAHGWGFEELQRMNPGVILVSITPYGQSGPYSDFKSADITLMAMGGQMYGSGEPDTPPVRITVPQAYLHGGIHAAIATLMALHRRARTGAGEVIDVSIQEAVARLLVYEPLFWAFRRRRIRRTGHYSERGSGVFRQVWRCMDGHVAFVLLGGPFSHLVTPLLDWIQEERLEEGDDRDLGITDLDLGRMAQEEIARIEDEVGRFLQRRTKAELWEVALNRGIPLAPVNSLEDLLRDEHLRQRGFWVQVTDQTSERNATSTSLPFIINNNRPVSGSIMPVAGQHNTAVYGQLGPTHAEQQRIHLAGVVDGSRRTDARPLEGVRIVELMRALAGDWATSYLADFGAEVIKVENSAVPDLTRITGPYAGGEPHLDQSYSFAWGNTGKKSIGLDLKTPQGVSLFKRLVASADVVAENLSPGAMERMGLGYEELVECNSQIIVLSSKIAGGHGPSQSFRGFGIQLAAMSSYCELTGWPDREPTQPHIAYTDPIAAWYSVLAILAALESRNRRKGPQFIDLSHFEAGVSFVSQAVTAHSMGQVEITRNGNKDDNACPHGAYPCKGDDHWIAVAVRNEPEWRAFCTALAKPDWCTDPRYVDLRQRKLREEELDRAIGI